MTNPTTTPGTDLVEIKGQSYAGLGSRFLALLMDGLLLCALFFPTTRIVKGVWIMSPAEHQWRVGWFITDPLCLIFLGVITIYFVALEGTAGWTVGKWLLGLRVIRKEGGKANLSDALIRNFFRLVDGLPAFSLLGAILIAVTKEKTRVGDLVAGTRVVKLNR